MECRRRRIPDVRYPGGMSDDFRPGGMSYATRRKGAVCLCKGERVVVPAKALMPTMLVQEHKDKTITHMVHEVLTWFGQPCLRPQMRENDSTIQ